jgi:DNA (cytosine-5)-methyltransferase 1
MSFVLSIFPGIDLLGRAFEDLGFCVVRGPDVIFGGDIRGWHVPAGRFQGIIGGPPCQCFSELRKLLRSMGKDTKAVNLIPEFCRVVSEAKPRWWLMENVAKADNPSVDGYQWLAQTIRDDRFGGHTKRRRRFWFGTPGEVPSALVLRPTGKPSLFPSERAVTRNCRIPDTTAAKRAARKDGGMLPGQGRYMPLADVCELQGLPRDFCGGLAYTTASLRIMLGNGVPMAMGRALAKAVKELEENEGI